MELTIDYVLEGKQRGYAITSPTDGIDDTLIKAIWRQAMPRGTGWSDYTGGRSIKVFRLPDEQIAVSEIAITPDADENGRTGIRRARVQIIPPNEYERHLRARWTSYPSTITAVARERCATLSRKLPRLKADSTLVLTYPYESAAMWQLVEAAMIWLMIEPPRQWRKHDTPIPFTTLALDHRSENPLIAMPQARSADLDVVKMG